MKIIQVHPSGWGFREQGGGAAFTPWGCNYYDPETGWPICRDEWDSLGPGRGIARERFGGFVSTSNLLLKKDACHFIFPAWSRRR